MYEILGLCMSVLNHYTLLDIFVAPCYFRCKLIAAIFHSRIECFGRRRPFYVEAELNV